jgi:uncharacterized protein
LTLGYFGLTGLLLARYAGFLGPIEQSGRASLSIYLGESVALSIIFCGYGFGLFGTFGSLGVLLVGVAVWVGLVLAATGWLRRFSQGPLEALVGRWVSASLSNGYWLRAQAACDIEVAERELAPELKKIKPWSGHAA